MTDPIRVLHVDDEPDLTELSATYLEREGDHLEVLTETSAADALERLGEEPVDCVVSDYDMPEMTGLELLDAVRDEHPDLPFILFTGKGSEEIASEAVSAGVTDYLQKEVGSDQYAVLANRIRQSVERRRAEARVEHSRERYRRLVETMPEPFLVHDTESILFANPAAVEFFGADSLEALLETEPIDLIHPEDRETIRRRRRAVHKADTSPTEEARSVALEIRCVTLDGETRHAVVRGTPIVYEGRECAQVVFRDVTEREQRERELRRSERRFEAVFDDPESMITLLDTDGTLLQANETAQAVLGPEPADLEGKPLWETAWWNHSAAGREQFQSWLERAAAGEFVREEVTHHDAAGGRIETDLALRPVRDEDGDVTSVIAEGRDVTQCKRAEHQFRSLFENIPDPAALVRREDGVFVVQAVNPAFEATFGYDAADAADRSIDDLIVPEDDLAEAEEINRRIGDGEQVERVVPRRTADGTVREFLFRNARIRSAGEQTMHFGVYTDVTERKKREREVELFRQLLDHSNDSVYVIDPDDGAFLDVNATACERLGYDREELLERSIADIDETGVSDHLESRVDVVREEGPLTREITHRRKDGTTFPVEIGVTHVELDRGEYLLAIGRDISERKEAERVLTALHGAAADLAAGDTVEEVCRNTIEAARDVLEFDRSGIYVAKNGHLAPVAGSEPVTGEPMPLGGPEEGIAGRAYRTGESVLIPDVADADLTPYHDRTRSALGVPIGDHGVFVTAAGEPEAVTEIDLELAELLVSHTESVLDRLDRERRLKQQNERLDEFASVVSHDLRNPLNVAIGQLDFLRDGDDAAALDRAESALERIDRIVETVLTMAREGDPVETTETVRLSESVARAWPYVETEDATVEVVEDVTFRADPGRLQHILENLLGNAVEHAGPDVTVKVGAFDGGFYVADDGPGVPPDRREEVFEPGRTTSDDGIGFGLSIVDRMATAHGWAVEATESETGGARFEVSGVETPARPIAH